MAYRKLRMKACPKVAIPEGCKPCEAIGMALDECCKVFKQCEEPINPLLKPLPVPKLRIPPKNPAK